MHLWWCDELCSALREYAGSCRRTSAKDCIKQSLINTASLETSDLPVNPRNDLKKFCSLLGKEDLIMEIESVVRCPGWGLQFLTLLSFLFKTDKLSPINVSPGKQVLTTVENNNTDQSSLQPVPEYTRLSNYFGHEFYSNEFNFKMF